MDGRLPLQGGNRTRPTGRLHQEGSLRGAFFTPAPAALVLSVDDCDAIYQQAVAAGAQSLFPPAVQSFGGRMGGVADAWGNEWYIATR